MLDIQQNRRTRKYSFGEMTRRVLCGWYFWSAALERRWSAMFTFILRRRAIFHGTWKQEMKALLANTHSFIISAASRSGRALPYRIVHIFVRERTITRNRIFHCCVRRL